MLCDVVRRRRRRWAHAPVIHAASHFDQKKRVAWVPISMHTCGSFFYNYGAPLGGPKAAGVPLIIHNLIRVTSCLKKPVIRSRLEGSDCGWKGRAEESKD